jgi:hypothetical protein
MTIPQTFGANVNSSGSAGQLFAQNILGPQYPVGSVLEANSDGYIENLSVGGVIAPLLQAERFNLRVGSSKQRVELLKARYFGLGGTNAVVYLARLSDYAGNKTNQYVYLGYSSAGDLQYTRGLAKTALANQISRGGIKPWQIGAPSDYNFTSQLPTNAVAQLSANIAKIRHLTPQQIEAYFPQLWNEMIALNNSDNGNNRYVRSAVQNAFDVLTRSSMELMFAELNRTNGAINVNAIAQRLELIDSAGTLRVDRSIYNRQRRNLEALFSFAQQNPGASLVERVNSYIDKNWQGQAISGALDELSVTNLLTAGSFAVFGTVVLSVFADDFKKNPKLHTRVMNGLAFGAGTVNGWKVGDGLIGPTMRIYQLRKELQSSPNLTDALAKANQILKEIRTIASTLTSLGIDMTVEVFLWRISKGMKGKGGIDLPDNVGQVPSGITGSVTKIDQASFTNLGKDSDIGQATRILYSNPKGIAARANGRPTDVILSNGTKVQVIISKVDAEVYSVRFRDPANPEGWIEWRPRIGPKGGLSPKDFPDSWKGKPTVRSGDGDSTVSSNAAIRKVGQSTFTGFGSESDIAQATRVLYSNPRAVAANVNGPQFDVILSNGTRVAATIRRVDGETYAVRFRDPANPDGWIEWRPRIGPKGGLSPKDFPDSWKTNPATTRTGSTTTRSVDNGTTSSNDPSVRKIGQDEFTRFGKDSDIGEATRRLYSNPDAVASRANGQPFNVTLTDGTKVVVIIQKVDKSVYSVRFRDPANPDGWIEWRPRIGSKGGLSPKDFPDAWKGKSTTRSADGGTSSANHPNVRKIGQDDFTRLGKDSDIGQATVRMYSARGGIASRATGQPFNVVLDNGTKVLVVISKLDNDLYSVRFRDPTNPDGWIEWRPRIGPKGALSDKDFPDAWRPGSTGAPKPSNQITNRGTQAEPGITPLSQAKLRELGEQSDIGIALKVLYENPGLIPANANGKTFKVWIDRASGRAIDVAIVKLDSNTYGVRFKDLTNPDGWLQWRPRVATNGGLSIADYPSAWQKPFKQTTSSFVSENSLSQGLPPDQKSRLVDLIINNASEADKSSRAAFGRYIAKLGADSEKLGDLIRKSGGILAPITGSRAQTALAQALSWRLETVPATVSRSGKSIPAYEILVRVFSPVKPLTNDAYMFLAKAVIQGNPRTYSSADEQKLFKLLRGADEVVVVSQALDGTRINASNILSDLNATVPNSLVGGPIGIATVKRNFNGTGTQKGVDYLGQVVQESPGLAEQASRVARDQAFSRGHTLVGYTTGGGAIGMYSRLGASVKSVSLSDTPRSTLIELINAKLVPATMLADFDKVARAGGDVKKFVLDLVGDIAGQDLSGVKKLFAVRDGTLRFDFEFSRGASGIVPKPVGTIVVPTTVNDISSNFGKRVKAGQLDAIRVNNVGNELNQRLALNAQFRKELSALWKADGSPSGVVLKLDTTAAKGVLVVADGADGIKIYSPATLAKTPDVSARFAFDRGAIPPKITGLSAEVLSPGTVVGYQNSRGAGTAPLGSVGDVSVPKPVAPINLQPDIAQKAAQDLGLSTAQIAQAANYGNDVYQARDGERFGLLTVKQKGVDSLFPANTDVAVIASASDSSMLRSMVQTAADSAALNKRNFGGITNNPAIANEMLNAGAKLKEVSLVNEAAFIDLVTWSKTGENRAILESSGLNKLAKELSRVGTTRANIDRILSGMPAEQVGMFMQVLSATGRGDIGQSKLAFKYLFDYQSRNVSIFETAATITSHRPISKLEQSSLTTKIGDSFNRFRANNRLLNAPYYASTAVQVYLDRVTSKIMQLPKVQQLNAVMSAGSTNYRNALERTPQLFTLDRIVGNALEKTVKVGGTVFKGAGRVATATALTASTYTIGNLANASRTGQLVQSYGIVSTNMSPEMAQIAKIGNLSLGEAFVVFQAPVLGMDPSFKSTIVISLGKGVVQLPALPGKTGSSPWVGVDEKGFSAVLTTAAAGGRLNIVLDTGNGDIRTGFSGELAFGRAGLNPFRATGNGRSVTPGYVQSLDAVSVGGSSFVCVDSVCVRGIRGRSFGDSLAVKSGVISVNPADTANRALAPGQIEKLFD